jgi:hypothetical protein
MPVNALDEDEQRANPQHHREALVHRDGSPNGPRESVVFRPPQAEELEQQREQRTADHQVHEQDVQHEEDDDQHL